MTKVWQGLIKWRNITRVLSSRRNNGCLPGFTFSIVRSSKMMNFVYSGGLPLSSMAGPKNTPWQNPRIRRHLTHDINFLCFKKCDFTRGKVTFLVDMSCTGRSRFRNFWVCLRDISRWRSAWRGSLFVSFMWQLFYKDNSTVLASLGPSDWTFSLGRELRGAETGARRALGGAKFLKKWAKIKRICISRGCILI